MISVIIPAYNAEEFLSQAMDSILGQTYQDLEILVINDGSTDATAALVEAKMAGNPRVKLITVENGGVSRARNIGLDQAKGEYVAFLDADDRYLPDAMENMLRCIEAYGADICATRKDSVGAGLHGAAVLWSRETAIENVIADHPSTHSVWAKLYRADCLRAIRFPEGKRVHEDSFFLAQCIAAGLKVVDWPVATYHYNYRAGSVSRSGFSEKMFDMLELSEQKAQIIREKFPEYADQTVNIQIKAHMAFLRNLCKTRDRKYEEAEQKSLAFVRNNRRYFVPASRDDARWFFILTHSLYRAYKMAYRIRFGLS